MLFCMENVIAMLFSMENFHSDIIFHKKLSMQCCFLQKNFNAMFFLWEKFRCDVIFHSQILNTMLVSTEEFNAMRVSIENIQARCCFLQNYIFYRTLLKRCYFCNFQKSFRNFLYKILNAMCSFFTKNFSLDIIVYRFSLLCYFQGKKFAICIEFKQTNKKTLFK